MNKSWNVASGQSYHLNASIYIDRFQRRYREILCTILQKCTVTQVKGKTQAKRLGRCERSTCTRWSFIYEILGKMLGVMGAWRKCHANDIDFECPCSPRSRSITFQMIFKHESRFFRRLRLSRFQNKTYGELFH